MNLQSLVLGILAGALISKFQPYGSYFFREVTKAGIKGALFWYRSAAGPQPAGKK